jgi:flap endonuclease-1
MGLSVKDIISKKEIEIPKLKGKVLAVDAFNTLYQFLSTIRQHDGMPLMDENKNITSHLSGIFYRNIALLSEGLKLIYVFDGKPPELKAKIHKKRGMVRDSYKEKYELAKQSEDITNMRKYSSQLIRLDDEMIKESKELLEALGVAVIQAPSEGEAEAANLAKTNQVYASVSQDYDTLLFGTPLLIKNLTLARKKKTFAGYIEVKPEIIELEKVLEELEINLEQLICIGILVGTDYNPKGIPRIGQKKALKYVKEYVTKEEIFYSLKEKIDALEPFDQFDPYEIYDLFAKPNVNETKDEIKFTEINFEKIKDILVTRHGFSEERIEKQLDKLRKIAEDKKQGNLEKWF